MSDLPEINFKKKEDKKKGFLPWLRSHLGVGGRSGTIGGAGEALPGAANLGRAAFGAGKFGASAGVGGMLAGKAGLVLTALIVSAAIGTSLYMKMQPAPGVSTSAFSSNRTPDTYVPAILRQNQSPGSSLDMFKDTNKGSLGMDAPAVPTDEAKDSSKDEAAKEDKPAVDPNAPAPGAGPNVQDMMGKLAGGSFGGGLSNSMGGGNSKFSNMGGFGNKFNSGAAGGKAPGFGSVGSGFQASPKFDQRKKLLAMKGSKTPVFSKSKGAKGAYGKGAFGQAKGLKSMQKSYSGKEIDSLAGTQNKAWTGATSEGDATGGGGLTNGDGGAGVVTSPSVDNANTGGGGGNTPDPTITDPTTPEDVSPWKGLPEKAMMYIMLSAMLSVIGGILCKIGKGGKFWLMILYIIGVILCVAAMALGAMAIMIGIKLASSFGQGMLGSIYILGGGVAIVAAIAALTGAVEKATGISALWWAAIAGIIGMLGSMAGG